MLAARRALLPSKRSRVSNSALVEMAKQVMMAGPHIGEVSRRTGIHKETLRHWFRKYFLEQGLVVQANLNYTRLGFVPFIVVAKLSPKFGQNASELMLSLSQNCYLTSCVETILEGLYILRVSVPSELREECCQEYERLHSIGVFREMQVLKFEAVRDVMMRLEYYDFLNGAWKYDFSTSEVVGGLEFGRRAGAAEKYDLKDLIILKELETDASQTLREIANSSDITHKAVLYHYTNHVLGRGLIRNYGIRWQGWQGESGRIAEDERVGRRSYLDVAIMLKESTLGQQSDFAANLSQIPFLSFEASGPDYYAEMFVPPACYSEFLKRLRRVALRIGVEPKLFILDQSRSLSFPLPYKLYDRGSKKGNWRLPNRA